MQIPSHTSPVTPVRSPCIGKGAELHLSCRFQCSNGRLDHLFQSLVVRNESPRHEQQRPLTQEDFSRSKVARGHAHLACSRVCCWTATQMAESVCSLMVDELRVVASLVFDIVVYDDERVLDIRNVIGSYDDAPLAVLALVEAFTKRCFLL